MRQILVLWDEEVISPRTPLALISVSRGYKYQAPPPHEGYPLIYFFALHRRLEKNKGEKKGLCEVA